MTTIKAVLPLVAAAAVVCATHSVDARETPLPQLLRAPGTLHWTPLLAQAERKAPTCRDDEKEVPRGSSMCRKQKLSVCGPKGSWEDTGKPC